MDESTDNKPDLKMTDSTDANQQYNPKISAAQNITRQEVPPAQINSTINSNNVIVSSQPPNQLTNPAQNPNQNTSSNFMPPTTFKILPLQNNSNTVPPLKLQIIHSEPNPTVVNAATSTAPIITTSQPQITQIQPASINSSTINSSHNNNFNPIISTNQPANPPTLIQLPATFSQNGQTFTNNSQNFIIQNPNLIQIRPGLSMVSMPNLSTQTSFDSQNSQPNPNNSVNFIQNQNLQPNDFNLNQNIQPYQLPEPPMTQPIQPPITYTDVEALNPPPDLFLLGTCWFFAGTGLVGYFNVDPLLKDIIERHGGVVITDYCDLDLVTHIIVPDQNKTPQLSFEQLKNLNVHIPPHLTNKMNLVTQPVDGNFYKLAINKNKYPVTIDYLYDLLSEKKFLIPWKWTHIPSNISANNSISPMTSYLYKKSYITSNQFKIINKHSNKLTTLQAFLKSHIISITGFNLVERNEISSIIRKLGGTVHTHLNKTCTLVLASNKTVSCLENFTLKIKKAMEWKLNVVTFTWLRDILLGVKGK